MGRTSLPELAVTFTAAFNGFPQLAVSNAVGGIAAQTIIIATADLFYRKANLEHAAPSVPNMLIGTLLLLGAYLWGMRLAFRLGKHPLWAPRKTPLTQTEHPDSSVEPQESLPRLWVTFAILAILPVPQGGSWHRPASFWCNTPD